VRGSVYLLDIWEEGGGWGGIVGPGMSSGSELAGICPKTTKDYRPGAESSAETVVCPGPFSLGWDGMGWDGWMGWDGVVWVGVGCC